MTIIDGLPTFLTPTDLARLLQLQPTTIREWSRQGRLPPSLRLTGRVQRWHRDQVASWLQEFGLPTQDQEKHS